MNMLLELGAVLTTAPDNEYQTPLSLTLSKGRDGLVKIMLGWVNVDIGTSEHHRQVSIPPSGEHGDKHAVEMQFGYSDPNTNIPDLSDQPTPPTARPQRAGSSIGLQEFCFHTRR